MPVQNNLLEDPGPALSALTQRPAGLFVDFDGTISRLAPTPDEAIASPGAVSALGRLSGRLAVVCVLSGRRAHDIRDKVGLRDLLYVGNHGAESIDGDVHSISPLAQQHGDAIERLLREAARAGARRRDDLGAQGVQRRRTLQGRDRPRDGPAAAGLGPGRGGGVRPADVLGQDDPRNTAPGRPS